MPSLLQLLRLRASQAWLAFERGSRRERVVVLAVSAAVVLSLFIASHRMCSTLRAEGAAVLAEGLVRAALHASFLFALLRDAVSVPGQLLRARDSALFVSSPISSARVLGLRLGEALTEAAGPMLQFGAPVVLGYAVAAPRPAAALLAAIPGLVVLVLLSVLTMAILTLLAPEQWSGAARRRRLAFAIAGFLVMLAALFLATGGWESAGPRVEREVTAFAVAADALLPSGWVGLGLVRAGEGEPFPVVLWGALFLLLAGLVYVLWSIRDLWQDAWCRAAEADARRRPTKVRRSEFRLALRIRHGGLRVGAALPRRDAILFWREPGMLPDVLFLAFLLGILPALFGGAMTGGGEVPWSLVAGIVAAELAFEIASRSLLLERRATHWLRAAPVPEAAVGVTRVAMGAVLGLLAAAASTALGGRTLLSLPLGTTLVIASLALAAASVGWLASLWLGEPDWRHPRQMLRLAGRFLLLAVVALAAWGFSAARVGGGQLSTDMATTQVTTWPWVAAVALAVAFGAVFWGSRARPELV